MDISAKVRILAGMQTGSVYYFEEEKLSSSEPHYFVVLNNNPKTDKVLILLCASSQVEKRKQIAKKLGFAPETAVVLNSFQYPLFIKETIIDCNSAFEKTAQSLIDKLEQGKLKICIEIMPKEIVEKLVEGVVASNQIEERIKKALR